MRLGEWMMRTGAVSAVALAAMTAASFAPAARAPEPAAQVPEPATRAPDPAIPVPAPVPVGPAAASPAIAPAPSAPEPLVVRRILDIPGPIRFGDYYWNTDGAPADAPLTITVDLEAETMSVFRGGYEIGATAILYGMDGKPTPLGVFPITQKKVHHISNLYGAPMPYMMRLTNDGVAIHASEVEMGLATHGCIGVPLPFARLIYAQAKLGDRVIITRGKRIGQGDVVAPG